MTRALPSAAVALTAALAVSAAGAPASPYAHARTVGVAVYFARGEHVFPLRRVVHPPEVARAALTALLAGPTSTERRGGYRSLVPAGTALRSVVLRGGVATVDVSRGFIAGGGSLSMQLRVAQVVYTATQFPGVSRVAFRIDGAPVRAIGGEGVIVWPPVSRRSFEVQAPAILVERPLAGDGVTSPVRVAGTANVFEAQFTAELRTAGGTILVRRPVRAASGTGVRGAFVVFLPVPAELRRALVVVYDSSPRNGAPVDVVRTPVRVSR